MATWHEYVVVGINPEPWEAPQMSAFRKGGKTNVHAYKTANLAAYQAAIREEMELIHGGFVAKKNVDLEFYFWRNSGHGQPADATNLQKSLEDAMQGLLYKNDRIIRRVQSLVVEQTPTTEPIILIRIKNGLALPAWITKLAEQIRNKPKSEINNAHLHELDDVF